MTFSVWVGIEFLASFIDMAFVILIPTFQLNKLRDGVKKWHIIAYIIFFSIVVTIYNYLTDNGISSAILGFPIVLVYAMYFIVGNRIVKVFWIVFSYSTTFFLSLVIIDMTEDIYQVSLDQLLVPSKYRLLLLVLTKILELLIVICAYRYQLKFDKKYKGVIIPLSISALIILILELANLRIWYVVCIAFIINFTYLAYIIKLNRIESARRSEEYMNLKLQNAFESMVLQEYMRRYQEDVNVKLQNIWEHMKTNNISNKGKVTDEIFQINTKMQQLYDTGNHVLDTTLSLKEALAARKGITLQSKIEKPLEPRLNYVEVSSILMHLIDNAIEAIERIPIEDEVDKIVLLSMGKEEDGWYMIEMENPTDCMYIPPLDILLSESNKGLGLKAVKKIVDTYEGILEFEHKDGYFTVSVRLPVNVSNK